MHSVKMSLKPDQLSTTMADMRIWLDERRFEPAVFCCRDNGAEIVVTVNFTIGAEAKAFADQFRGILAGVAGAALDAVA
jgi:hypothetical protein